VWFFVDLHLAWFMSPGLVVAAFGFDDFAGVRVLVDLHLAWLTGADTFRVRAE